MEEALADAQVPEPSISTTMKIMVFLFLVNADIDFIYKLCYNKLMTEFQPPNNESSDETDKLVPADMDEAFIADGARRTLEGVWNPEDADWKEGYEAHRLLMDAGMVEPAVDLDKIAKAVADMNEARKLVDAVFEQHVDNDEGPTSN